jgi:hypothetical protein
MANITNKNGVQFSSLDGVINYGLLNFGVTISRSNPIPLDATTLFRTLDEAKTYAETSVVAYAGQQISVVETEYDEDGTTIKNVNVQAYIVAGSEQADGSWLIPVSQGANMSDVEITVWEEWSDEQQ